MAKKPLSDTEMVSAPDEFEGLYRANAPLIYRFMFWRTRDELLAEDLTSSVFEKAWRTRAGFAGGSAKAWLFRIARTTLIDHWRKRTEVPDDGAIIDQVVSDAPDLSECLDRKLAAEQLQKAFVRLPGEMRRVVELRFIQCLPVRKVARELGISEANVRVIQYRALRKLRGYLHE